MRPTTNVTCSCANCGGALRGVRSRIQPKNSLTKFRSSFIIQAIVWAKQQTDLQLQQKQRGFTIVELLIVIVVIGILAAITIVAYNGIQGRARQTKISSDLNAVAKAIGLARTQTGQVLGSITNSSATANSCVSKPNGTDLSALPKTDSCWVDYLSALDKISVAGGANIRGLVDPWGRPYYLDENEYEGGSTNCTKDHLGAYQVPFVSSWTAMSGSDVWIANSMPNC